MIRKTEPVGDFRHREVGGLQQHLDLEQHHPVDNLLGCSGRNSPHDGGKVAGRDTEPVGEIGHLALFVAMFVHQRDKAQEQLPPTVVHLPGLAAVDVALDFIVNLQKNVLQTILDDGVAEDIFAVGIRISGHLQPDISPFAPVVEPLGNRVLVEEVEKRRVEPEARFGEQGSGKSTVGDPEIVGNLRKHEDCAR